MQKESVILQNRGSLPILPQMQEDCHSLQIYRYNISINFVNIIYGHSHLPIRPPAED